MRLNRLDLNLLVTLDALLTERSITRAAERIHLSQPATSGALARLREYFDDDLLVRVGAQMKPTPLGESLAAPVHNILLQIKATVERGVEFDPVGCDRTFRFLISDYSSTTIMASAVKHLAEVAPSIKLEFMAPVTSPREHLEQGEIDFLVMPTYALSDHHPNQVLFNESFVCVGWENNPVLQKGHITMEEYMSLGHVSVKFGSNRAVSQEQILLKKHFNLEPNIEITTSTFGTMPYYIEGTQRIGTIYRELGLRWAERNSLKTVKLPFDLPELQWHIQWHTYRDRDPSIQWMRKTIADIAREKYPQPPTQNIANDDE